ncbi:MAG: LysR family transcriptional regulator [Pseudomonadota bacterium]|nr:LysR family transcriptional regulator [Pseudomonadota bacterium]
MRLADRKIVRWDPKLLLAFDALRSLGSVTEAAKKLNITQQGLSTQLARLREITGDQLFQWSNTGMQLTPTAEKLSHRVKAAIAALEDLNKTEEFDPSIIDNEITIASTEYVITLLAPPILRMLREEAPRATLRLRHIEHKEVNSSSINETDLVLSVPEFLAPKCSGLHLFSETYSGFARSGHPINQMKSVNIDEFLQYDHILVSPFKGDAFGPTDVALKDLGKTRRIGLVVPDFSVVGDILSKTDLICVLPDRLKESLGEAITRFHTPVEIKGFDIFAYQPKHLEHDPLNTWLLKIIQRCVSEVSLNK